MEETKNKDTGLARARLIVLALIEDDCQPKTAVEIASMAQVPVSSAIRNLDNLCEIGWAKKRKDYYVIGEELLAISRAFAISLDHAVKKIRLDMHTVELQAHELLNKTKGDV